MTTLHPDDVRSIKTVNLDYLIDVASRYRRLRDPLHPLGTNVIDFESGLHGEDHIFCDDQAVGATRPWRSFSWITGAAGEGENPVEVVRVENVPRHRQRGYVRLPGLALSFEDLSPAKAHGCLLVAFQGGEWLTVANRWQKLPKPVRDPVCQTRARLALGFRLLQEYCWTAVFSIPQHAPFAIPTDARGALAIFKMRDKPADGARRPALHHWVEEHFRLGRSSERDIGVREHLRGRQAFEWSGINVELKPSPYDQERAQLATRPMRTPKQRAVKSGGSPSVRGR